MCLMSLLFISFVLHLTQSAQINEIKRHLSNIPRVSAKQSILDREYHFCGNDDYRFHFVVPESESCCIDSRCATKGNSAYFGGGGSKYFGWTINVGTDGKAIELHKWGGGWGGGNCKRSYERTKMLPKITCNHNVIGLVVHDVVYESPVLKSKHNPPKGSTLEFEIVKEQTEQWIFSENVQESERERTVSTISHALSSSSGWKLNVFKFGSSETESTSKSHEREVLKSRIMHWNGEVTHRVQVKEKYKLESGSIIVTMKCCKKYPMTLQYDGADERISFEECIDYTSDRLSCDDLWQEEMGGTPNTGDSESSEAASSAQILKHTEL